MKKIRYRIIALFRFFIKSKTIHSAHSPFLFNFIETLNHKANLSSKLALVFSLKNDLLNNHNLIEIHDFGTGNKKNKVYQSSIKKQAKRSLKKNSELITLYKVINKFEPKNIIELGTSFGISTSVFSMAYPECKIVTFEGCPNTSAKAQEIFEHLNLKNIKIIIGDINQHLPIILADSKPIDIAFIDANHTYQDTLNYFFQIKKLTNTNSLIIFDDIHWSKEINLAWKKIIHDTDVTLSIETWDFGYVFFNTDLSKQHFIFRK